MAWWNRQGRVDHQGEESARGPLVGRRIGGVRVNQDWKIPAINMVPGDELVAAITNEDGVKYERSYVAKEVIAVDTILGISVDGDLGLEKGLGAVFGKRQVADV